MTLKIGTLEADITADTRGLRAAEREWRQSAEGFQSAWQRSTAAVGRQFERIRARARDFTASFRPMRGAVQQASFQIQDFAVQVGAGTNALRAFSQQAPQFLSAFGPGGAILGAVVGVGTALAAGLLPALFDTRDGMDELEDSAKSLDETLRASAESGGGVFLLTEKIAELAEVSREAAVTAIRGEMVNAMSLLEAASSGAAEAVEDVVASLSSSNITAGIGQVAVLQDQFNLTRQEADALLNAIQDFSRNRDADGLARLTATIEGITGGAERADPELTTLATTLRGFTTDAERASDQLATLEAAEDDLAEALRRSAADTRASKQTIDLRREALRELREEAVRVQRAERGASAIMRLGETDLERIRREAEERRQFVLNETQFTETERVKLLERIAAEEARRRDEITARQREADVKNARQAAKERAEAEALSSQIGQLGESPIERINREAEERRAAVLAQERFTATERASLMEEIDREQLRALAEHNKAIINENSRRRTAEERAETAFQQRQATMQAAQQSAALAGLSALADAANDILRATGQEGTAIAKAIFLAQKAVQVAQIIAATEVAAANAAAVAALGGPVPFFATAGVIRAAGYASAGLVAGLAVGETFGGGRRFGGAVSPQMAHPINEAGVPEILNMAGRQYLLPTGQGGTITPMEGGSGPGMPRFTVINQGTPQNYEVDSITRDEVRVIATDVAAQTEARINGSLATGRGDTASSLRRGFRTERNLR